MMTGIRKRIAIAVALFLAVVALGFVVLGCHPSLITIKGDKVMPPSGISTVPPAQGIDGTIAGLLGAAAVAYLMVIRPLRLWLKGRNTKSD